MKETPGYVFTAFQVVPAGEIYEKEFLSLVGSVETLSSHPLSRAVLEAVRRNNFPVYPVIGFNEFPGSGLGGSVEIAPQTYRSVVIGGRPFIRECGLILPETMEVMARRWENEPGCKIAMAGWDGWVRGLLKFTAAESKDQVGS